jgi:hypothetical protein
MARFLFAIVGLAGTLGGMARECTRASGKMLFKVRFDVATRILVPNDGARRALKPRMTPDMNDRPASPAVLREQ